MEDIFSFPMHVKKLNLVKGRVRYWPKRNSPYFLGNFLKFRKFAFKSLFKANFEKLMHGK
jgi:hypothetical protein